MPSSPRGFKCFSQISYKLSQRERENAEQHRREVAKGTARAGDLMGILPLGLIGKDSWGSWWASGRANWTVLSLWP